eukprot:Nitzschia sp. Nitz4//scaffold94_size78252//65686//66399//NITZ4_005476-RA/size78252-processed-gene-0.15-mRNA-1//1//CDS//3329560404//5716//frame0
MAPPVQARPDSIINDVAFKLRRLSWLTWWIQVILTTVSSLILVFARNAVVSGAMHGAYATAAALGQSSQDMHHHAAVNAGGLPNFVLAGLGVGVSYASILWTWANRRLAGRMLSLSQPKNRIKVATMLRKSIDIGATMNVVGMLFALLSAEQIVGVLAMKVLTSARTIALTESNSLLQPLDVIIVQANTNTLLSHFCSLVAILYLSKSIARLDPPSREGAERSRGGPGGSNLRYASG